MVHGDAVVGVRGQLVQGERRRAVHRLVVGLEVGDKGPDGVQSPELVAVVVPTAAVGDCGRQVLSQKLVLLTPGGFGQTSPLLDGVQMRVDTKSMDGLMVVRGFLLYLLYHERHTDFSY